jgi:rod shape-determining protein MreC
MNQLAVSPQRSFGVFLSSLFVLLAIMSYQVKDPLTGRTIFGNVVFTVYSPVQRVVAGSFREVVDLGRNYLVLSGAARENEKLKREVADLRIRLAAGSHERIENERLRKILELREKLPYGLLAGEVIGRDATPLVSETLTVNRGIRSGVRRQMPVVTPEGIVGITISVDLFTSKVQLITDSSASIGAMLQKSRVAGILSGLGGGRCVLRFLPMNANLSRGDLVITSGQDGIFPEGMPVGRITGQIYESSIYRSAEVAPFQIFSSLDEVIFLVQSKVNKGSTTPAATGENGPSINQ